MSHDEDAPINLAAFRDLRARLARLAAERPHLVDPARGDDEAAWVATLKEAGLDEAGETKQVAFRLDLALIERVDRYAHGVRRRTGVKVSRTQAAVALLTLALDLLDQVDADPLLTGEPGTVRDLVTLALEGVADARKG